MPRSQVDDRHDLRQSRTVLLATDKQSSVIAKLAGDKPGAIAYTAYGQQPAQQQVVMGLGFNGELCEARLGWYLLGNGYRAYNPTLMRFHSPDSLSPFGKGGLNSYMYCLGDPVNFHDPNGKFATLVQSFANSFRAFFNRSARPIYSNGSGLTFNYSEVTSLLKETKTLIINKRTNNGWIITTTKINNEFSIFYFKNGISNGIRRSNTIEFPSTHHEINPSLAKLTYNQTPGKTLKKKLDNHSMPDSSKLDLMNMSNLTTNFLISNEMRVSARASIETHNSASIFMHRPPEDLLRDIRLGLYNGINPNNV